MSPPASRQPRSNLVNLELASKAYGDRTLLDQVSLGVSAGDRIGVVGRNGAGKSTLLAALAGRGELDSGRAVQARGLTVGYLPQDEQLGGTVQEIVLGRRPEHEWAGEARSRAVLAALLPGIDFRADVRRISRGERRRAALAALLLDRRDLLLLDEPTNHLDIEAIDWLGGFLRDQAGSHVVVTHDRWFLDAVTEQTWELAGGRVHAFDGGYSAYVLARAERSRLAGAVDQRRRSLLRKELAWLRRGPPARTSKPKFRIAAANDLIVGEPPARDPVELARLAVARLGKTVLDLEDVTVTAGQRVLLDDVSWQLGPGDRVGVVGVNGSGKTTLLRLLVGDLPVRGGEGTRAESGDLPVRGGEDARAESGDVPVRGDESAGAGAGDVPERGDGDARAENGELPEREDGDARAENGELPEREDESAGAGAGDVPVRGGGDAGAAAGAPVARGQVRRGSTVRVGYLTQEPPPPEPDLRALEAAERVRSMVRVGRGELSAAQLLDRLGLAGDRQWAPVTELSGGERRRLQLLLVLLSEPNVLLLDEPTNDLDIDTLTELEDLLDGWPGSVLVVSHDRYFLERVTDHIVALAGGALGYLPGGVEEYLRMRARPAAPGVGRAASGGPPASGEAEPGRGRGEAARQRASQKELARLERQIGRLTDSAASLNAALAEHASDYQKLIELGGQLRAVQQELASLEERWLSLAEEQPG